MLQRGQVDLGGYRAVLRRCHVRLPPADVIPLPSEGREPAAPRYHPPWPPGVRPWPPHWGRDAGSTRRPCGPRAFFRRLRGDLHDRARPRAPTVPGSLLAAYGATRPIHAFRCAQCTGPDGLTADRFNRGRGRDPNGAVGGRTESWAAGVRGRPGADYRAGSWAQRMQARLDRVRGGAMRRRAPLPRGWGRFIVPARFACKITICEGAAAMVAKKTAGRDRGRAEGRREAHRPTRRPRTGRLPRRRPRRRRPRRRRREESGAEEGAPRRKRLPRRRLRRRPPPRRHRKPKKTAAKKSAAEKASKKAAADGHGGGRRPPRRREPTRW